MYATSPNRRTIIEFLGESFYQLAQDFCNASGTKNMYMVRGSIAYGPVIHGKDISDSTFQGVNIQRDITNSILLSPAMVLAYKAESKAPPFGIYVDDSAKYLPVLSDSSDKGFISSLHQWWRGCDDKEYQAILPPLIHNIDHYMERAAIHSAGMNYPFDRIKAHKKLVEEYFGGYRSEIESNNLPNKANPADALKTRTAD